MDFLTLLLHDIIQLIAWLIEFPLSQAIHNPIPALIIFWLFGSCFKKIKPVEQIPEEIKEDEPQNKEPKIGTRKYHPKKSNAKKEDKKPPKEPVPIKEDTYPQDNSDEYCPF